MNNRSRKGLELAGIFIILLAAFLYRRWDAFTHPQLWAEAGNIIFQQWETTGFKSIITIYAGYYMTVQRLVAALIGLTHVSYLYIPLCYNLSAFIISFLVAVAIWRDALLMGIKHRMLYATIFVLIPVANELYMDEASLQWITGIYMVHYLFAWANNSIRRYYFLHLLLLFIFATSGPYSSVLAPLILMMIVVKRKEISLKKIMPLIVILAGGAIQYINIKFLYPGAYTGRAQALAGVEADKYHLFQLFTKNTAEEFFLLNGFFPHMADGVQVLLSSVILAGLIIFFVVGYRRIQNQNKYVLLLAAVLLFISFIVTYWPKESKILALELGRYYFYPFICVGWLMIIAWDEKIRLWHIGVYVIFLLLHAHFLIYRLPDKKWKEQIREYYQGKRDTIDINPDGWKVVLPKRAANG